MNTIIINKKENYITLQLNRGRANPINAEMVKEIRETLKRIEKEEEIKGIILTGQEGFFSAGLDVLELFHYNQIEMKQFWTDFTDMIVDLIQFPKPIIAAISGHSPAGGCILAICADYRIMIKSERYRIGLNEIPVGIVVPQAILEIYGFWLGKGKAYQALMEGKLFTTQEAYESNLLDVLVEDGNELMEKAEKQMKFYLSFPEKVWQQTKKNLRNELIKKSVVSESEKEDTLAEWWNPKSRAALEKLVNRLSSKKA